MNNVSVSLASHVHHVPQMGFPHGTGNEHDGHVHDADFSRRRSDAVQSLVAKPQVKHARNRHEPERDVRPMKAEGA